MLLNTGWKLASAGHTIPLVGTCREAPEYGVGVEDFRAFAEDVGAVFFDDHRINAPEVTALLQKVNADIAVSVNWLTVIGQEAIAAFGRGILNAHSGDLPRYRGNACSNWVLLNGERQLTLTVHFMDPESLDSGPIVLKRHRPLETETTIGEIYDWLETTAPEMFLEAVNGLEAGTLCPVPQNEDPLASLRCYPRIPSDSLLDWKQGAVPLMRLVKASSRPFAGAYTHWQGRKLVVWDARADSYPCPSLAVPGQVLWRDGTTGDVGVATGDGVLVLRVVQREGEEKRFAAEVLRSTRTRLGFVLDDEVAGLLSGMRDVEERLTEIETALRRLGAG